MTDYNTPVNEEHLKCGLALAKSAAWKQSRRVPEHVSFDDLYSEALFGLASRIRDYEAIGAASFRTFIGWRIRGAILDWMRRQDWASRERRGLSHLLIETHDRLHKELQRPISRDDLAEALGMTTEELDRRLISRAPPISFEDIQEPLCESSWLDSLSSPPKQDELEVKSAIYRALLVLPQDERFIIREHCLRGHSMRNVARRIGLSESRAFFLQKRAMKRLRRSPYLQVFKNHKKE